METSTTGIRMIDLGVLEGEDPAALSTGYGINQAGRVVGASGSSAFLWSQSRGFQRLDIGWAEALDINERGQVTGDRDFGCSGVGVWMGFIWKNGMWEDLGSLYGSHPSTCQAGSTGRAVNNRGQVVGWSETAPFDPDPDNWNQHGFLWEDGAMTDLGSLGDWSEAWGINGRGQIVGYTDSPLGGQACVWENGSIQPLGWLGPPGWSIAVAINNAGTVVGWSSTAAGPEHAYRWRDGLMEDLGALDGGYPWSKAKAINGLGMIVGVSVPDPDVPDPNIPHFAGRATMWEPGAGPGQAIDLGTLPGGTYSSAFAVNNRGVIAGWSDTGSGEFHAVLWLP
jgi:probable HAF family extracellular repeat protein